MYKYSSVNEIYLLFKRFRESRFLVACEYTTKSCEMCCFQWTSQSVSAYGIMMLPHELQLPWWIGRKTGCSHMAEYAEPSIISRLISSLTYNCQWHIIHTKWDSCCLTIENYPCWIQCRDITMCWISNCICNQNLCKVVSEISHASSLTPIAHSYFFLEKLRSS